MPDPLLVLLPPPGAGTGIFRPWQNSNLAERLRPIQLPAREDRFLVPVYRSREEAVADLLDRIRASTGGAPYVLFGHCGLSLVALDLASRLEALGEGPARLVVSGSPSPRRRRVIPREVVEADILGEELFAELGLHDAAAADPELMELMTPAIRSDCALFADPEPYAATVVTAPISVLAAASLDDARRDDAADWRHSTTGGCSVVDAGLPDDYLHTALPRLGEVLGQLTTVRT